MSSQTATNANSYTGYASANPDNAVTTGAGKCPAEFYRLSEQVFEMPGLTAAAKLVFAVLCWIARDSDRARASMSLLTHRLKMSRSTVRRALRLLERAGLLLMIPGRWARSPRSYQINPDYRTGKWVPILKRIVDRQELSPIEKLGLSLASYRLGENDYCWPTQRNIAENMGISKRTAQRMLDRLRQDGDLVVVPGRFRCDHTNRYYPTLADEPDSRIFGGKKTEQKLSAAIFGDKKRQVTKWYPLVDKTSKETPSGVGFLKQKFSFSPILSRLTPESKGQDRSTAQSRVQTRAGPAYKTESTPEQKAFHRLLDAHIAPKVARPMAFEQHVPCESVDQAIRNGEILRNSQRQENLRAGLPKPYFNLPGYVVRAVSGARREGKIVKKTKLFRELRRQRAAHKKAETRRKGRQPLSLEEFEKRRQAMKAALEADSTPVAGSADVECRSLAVRPAGRQPRPPPG